MAAVVANGHGQCYATMHLGQPLPSSTERKPSLQGKFRIPMRRKVVLHHAVRVQSQAGFGRGTIKVKEEESQEEDVESEPAGGTRKLFNIPGSVKLPGTVKLQGSGQAKPKSSAKSNQVVFVAGATGKVGSRTVRELLKLGFQVRASTRNAEKAQAMFEDALQSASADPQPSNGGPFDIFSPAKLFGFLNPKPAKLLDIVVCDLEDAESIEPALGNAGVVVCCIGASEKEVLDVTGPYRIDFKATKNLIDAASSAQVNHFVLLTSLGTQKFGFPAAVLNLFWGVLIWKAKAEDALIQSGLPYTIVRPGGMERPTDAYKETHNLRLAEADKLFGGQVSNLQVAELLACIVENPDVSMNKIVEAVAETTAPLRPIRELLEEIPADDSPAVQLPKIKKGPSGKVQVAAQKASKKPAEKIPEDRAPRLEEEKRIQAKKLAEEEKRIQAEKLAEQRRMQAEKDREEKERLKAEALRNKYEEEIEAAREKEEAAKAAAAAALAEKVELEKRVAEVRVKAEAAALAASQAKAVEAAVLAAVQRGNVLSEEEKQKIMEAVRLERLPKADGRKESAVSTKKKPALPFLGRVAPSSTVTESPSELPLDDGPKKQTVKTDKQAKPMAKAEKDASAEKKRQEEVSKKEEAKKLAEEEAARAVEAKRKEEQDKLEKEAKALAQQEAEKAAAEVKKKEEEEEAKKKEEQEKVERLKAEEEEKAKALAEQEAAAAAKAEAEMLASEKAEQKEEGASKDSEAAPQPARQKGFRWFWQPAEPDVPEEGSETSATGDTIDMPVEVKAVELPRSSVPLSPYTRYPGLKPPSSPLPSPPIVAKQPKAGTPSPPPPPTSSDTDKEASKSETMVVPEDVETGKQEDGWLNETTEDTEVRKKLVMEIMEREREALEKAQAATSFLWPWQKKNSEPPVTAEPSALTAEMQPKSEPTLSSSDQFISEETKPPPRNSRPLSPYFMYPGLKPPSPPIPPLPKTISASPLKSDTLSPEINNVEQNQDKVELLLEKDNENVVAEEPRKESEENIEARRLQVQEIIAREREALEKAKAATSFMWPWQKGKVLEEEPDGPTTTEGSAVVTKEEEPIPQPQEPISQPLESAKVETATLQASSRPLSPYIQYPDLKPPCPPKSSPPPQLKSSVEKEPTAAEATSSTPLSPYTGFPDLKPPTSPGPSPKEDPGNGAVPDESLAANEEVTEPAAASSGFKWPWQ